MSARIRAFRNPSPGLAVAIAAGLLIAPQASGAPPQSEQAERALREAVAAAERAIQDERAVLVETLQEAAEKAEIEARLQDEHVRQRMRMVAPQLARAHAWGLMGGRGADRILAHAEELELSADQQERLRAADKANRRAAIEREAQIEVAELDLEDMLRDLDTADLNAVETKMLAISQLKVAGRVADLRLRQQLDGILTQEQRDKLEDMRGDVMFLRGGEPGMLRFKREGGPGAEFFFGRGELFEPFEWIEDFEFEMPGGVYEFRFGPDEDDEDVEAPPAGSVKKRAGTIGSTAPVAPRAPVATRSS